MTLSISHPRAKSRWTFLSIIVGLGLIVGMMLPMIALAAPPKISLEQCRNGAAATPNDCLTLGGSSGWVNGNAGASNAHFVEGHSIPYRAIITDGPLGTNTVTLGYDIKHSGTNAIDFLTHYQRLDPHGQFMHGAAEMVFPLSGTSGVAADPPATCDIPKPSNLSTGAANTFDHIKNVDGKNKFTVFGASSCMVTQSVADEGDLGAAQSEARVVVEYVAISANVVLAWGGHIARSVDWNGNGAAQISGSPYHMRLKAWSAGNVGNQDRSLSAAAVLSEASQSTTQLHERTTSAGTTDVNPANNGLAIAVPLGSFVNDVLLLSPATATGTATFRYYSTGAACEADSAGAAGTTAGVSVPVSGGTATSTTLSTTTLGVGTFYFRVFFAGTPGEFDDSISPCNEILQVFDPLTRLEVRDQLTGLPTGAVGSVVYRAYANADGATALAACAADAQSAANPFGTAGTSLSPIAQAVAGALGPLSTNSFTVEPGNTAYFKAFFVGSGGSTPTTNFATACSKEAVTVGQ